jgi:hypothetical protein
MLDEDLSYNLHWNLEKKEGQITIEEFIEYMAMQQKRKVREYLARSDRQSRSLPTHLPSFACSAAFPLTGRCTARCGLRAFRGKRMPILGPRRLRRRVSRLRIHSASCSKFPSPRCA